VVLDSLLRNTNEQTENDVKYDGLAKIKDSKPIKNRRKYYESI
jgi:hypothetical protein